MRSQFNLFCVYSITLFLVNTFAMQGQQSIKKADYLEHFRKAKSYFDSNNFTAAQEEFRFYLISSQNQNGLSISERTTVEYYIAICSIYSMRPEAEIQAVKFIADHPESPYTAKLVTQIGVFYYETGDWVRAIKYLSTSSQTNIEHKYYLAISYYKSAQYQEALNLFNLLKLESEEEFAFPSAYYAGVMHYQSAMYEKAIGDFKIASADPRYSSEAPVWIISAYLKLNRYSDLIGYIEPVLGDSTYEKSAGNLASIVAELQFQRKDYINAAKSYSIVLEKSASIMNRERTFKYAYSLYKVERYDDALRMLGQPTQFADSLDQEIARTRALILVERASWDVAFQALKTVADMPFNQNLAEEAMLMALSLLEKNQQWTKLLSELKEFQVRFPRNKHADLLVSYALESLMKKGDLSTIEEFILNFPIGKVKFQELYQSTCYQLANSSYEKREDSKAVVYFKKSLNFPINREMAWYCRYALGEISSRVNRNSDAIKVYLPLLAETSLPNGSPELSQRIRLSLAYSFAYITYYDRSLKYFQEFVANKPNAQKSIDDLRNLAEISIANGDISAGMKFFDEAIAQNTTEVSSILDRKFAIYYNLRKYKEAASVYQDYLNKFPTNHQSDLVFVRVNEALIRLQNSEQYAKVIKNSVQFLQQKPPTNPYIPTVLLLRAQAYENTNQWILALDDYISIVKKYTSDSSAKEAIIGASELLKKANRYSEVLELQRIYEDQYGKEAYLGDQWFEICSEIFRQKKYKLLISELVRLVQVYPAFSQSDELNYMLGVSTYHVKDFTNSVKYLKNINPSSNFSKHSLWILALIYEEQKKLDLAVDQLVDLKANLSFQDTLTIEVHDKLKHIYIQQRKFELLDKLWNDVELADSTRSKWAFEIGQSVQENQDLPLAIKWFERAVLFSLHELGARASLGIAKCKSIQKDWKGSNSWIISQFVQTDSRYNQMPDSIIGLAYIQMADNFVQLMNLPQAKVILQSILANSSDESMKVLAKKKLDEIQ